MSLALLQSYSSAEEDEAVNDELWLRDQISSDDGAKDAVPKTRSYKPLFDPNPRPSSSLPSAFDAFSEIASPPQFLNNSVEENPQKVVVQQWSPSESVVFSGAPYAALSHIADVL